MATPEAQLTALGIVLGEPAAPVANFVATVRTGQLLYVSGQICFSGGKVTHVGQVGTDVSIEAGKSAARNAAINVLAHARKALGSLIRSFESCNYKASSTLAPASATIQPSSTVHPISSSAFSAMRADIHALRSA